MNRACALHETTRYSMLCEAIGDSEAEWEVLESDVAAAADDDDAQSCSYGDSGGQVIINELVDASDDDHHELLHGVPEFGFRDGDKEDDRGDSEDEEGVVDQVRGGGKAAQPAEGLVVEKVKKKRRKLAGYNDKESNNVKVMMDERERDRQFWEACLAS